MSQNVSISFDPANDTPTVARMMRSDSFVRLIAGPVGSGKTTGCIMELLRRSCEQKKADDGYRYTRFAIVRQTLKQLKDTVLKDITQWLDGICTYKVMDQAIYVEFGDVKSEWLMIPLDDPQDQRRLLSMQLTGAWLSECIEMDLAVVSPLVGRCGRYPNAVLGGATWSGVIADTNMPTEGSPWHKAMIEPPPDWQIFVQPGGMADNAENLDWLNQTPETLLLPKRHPDRVAAGRKYYERNMRNPSPDWVTRYVHARFGNDPSGTAVHRETFRRSFHVARVDKDGIALRAIRSMPLIIGQDFGRNPCSIVCQLDHTGRLNVLKEFVAQDTGLEVHVKNALLPGLMDERFIGIVSYLVGDPAGNQRSTSYEETSFDLLKKLGLNAFPAPTNDIDKRIRAVDSFLMGSANGGPRLLIDPVHCPKLIQALNGSYRYAKRRGGESAAKPDKGHPWSDLADALQYACLVANGGYSGYISNRLERKRNAVTATVTGPKFSSKAWT